MGLGGTGGGGLFVILDTVLISPLVFSVLLLLIEVYGFRGGSSIYFGVSSSCWERSGLAVPTDEALVPF